jgi:predicted permease
MSWINRLVGSLRKRPLENNLDDELQFHIEMRTQEFMASGMTPQLARYRAQRLFGNQLLLKERTRDMDTIGWIETLEQDVRYALRTLQRSRGFTLAAVLSLGLGIGANTAIFSLIDVVLLKLLPVKNPQQLVLLSWVSQAWPRPFLNSYDGNSSKDTSGRDTATSFSYHTFEQLRDHNRMFSSVFAFTGLDVNASFNGQAELVGGELVSGDYFAGLGVQPFIGQSLTSTHDRKPEPVMMISYGYWERRFGRDSTVLGKSIVVNGTPFTILGVTPREFFGVVPGKSPDVFIPMSMQPYLAAGPEAPRFSDPKYWWVLLMGRLKPGVSDAQARADLDVVFQQNLKEGQTSGAPSRETPHIEISPASKGLDSLRLEFSKSLFLLMAVVGLVLLIACANIANLLLARTTAREKEIAVRLAIGAGRIRLVRQLLTESILLASFGGIVGLLLAFGGSRVFVPLIMRSTNLNVRPDFRVLVFTAVVCIVTGVLFGLAPAFRATQVNPNLALKSSSSTFAGKGFRNRLARFLVVSQVSISLVLLIGAGLFVRTLVNLDSLDAGFNRLNILLFRIDPTMSGYKEIRLANFYEELVRRLEATPGVVSATLSRHALIGDGATTDNVSADDGALKACQDLSVHVHFVGARFFETLGTPVLLGRGIGAYDRENAPRVVVINESLARRCFGNDNPVGRQLTWPIGDSKTRRRVEIVGVAKNAKYASLQAEIPDTIYIPYVQYPLMLGAMVFEVRTAENPTGLVPAVHHALDGVDRNVPMVDVQTQVEQINGSLYQERLFSKLSTFFGLLALLLASIGLYGIMAYAVVRRTGEIGIRMALGAQRRQVMWLVLRETLSMLLISFVVGVPVALAATRFISGMLFGLKPSDPGTICLAALLMAAVACVASYIPARRASRVDPIVALRYE